MEAKVEPAQIHAVLQYFKLLRVVDETVYLRSASLNTMNAMVGLTFSCDGSHFIPVNEFLKRDLTFWFGSATGMGIIPGLDYAIEEPWQAG